MFKGALDLLADYGGDSSDDEVPSGRVSTKRIYKDEVIESNCKRFANKLPAPNFVITKNEEVIDDPSEHEGRIRSFSHERGNWATYVYIPFESNDGLQYLLNHLLHIVPKCIDLKIVQDFHLSLTKTVILKYHWINSFVSTLKTNLDHFTKFIIIFNCLNIYCNEERTRTFIGLQIQSGYDTLRKLVDCLDNCLTDFQLSKFYDDPSFHMSIAWCVGDFEEDLKSLLPQLNNDLHVIFNEYPQENWYIYVEHLLCKTGYKLYQFHLR